MLDEGHVDVAGEERELHGAQLVERPAFSAAARGDGLVPHRRHFFAQRLVFDLQQGRKKLRDFLYAVSHSRSLIDTNRHE